LSVDVSGDVVSTSATRDDLVNRVQGVEPVHQIGDLAGVVDTDDLERILTAWQDKKDITRLKEVYEILRNKQLSF